MQTIEPDGELGFSMVFQSKMTPFKRWVEPERVQKYVNFFGPGVDAEVGKENAPERSFYFCGDERQRISSPSWEGCGVVRAPLPPPRA